PAPACPTPTESHRFLSLFLSLLRPPPTSTLFPYTTLFRSTWLLFSSRTWPGCRASWPPMPTGSCRATAIFSLCRSWNAFDRSARSEEHTSELQSRFDLVCRLLLEKKKEDHNKLGYVLMRTG